MSGRDDLRVAVSGPVVDRAAPLAAIAAVAERAALAGAALLVLPELVLTGGWQAPARAEESDGELAHGLGRVAAAQRIAIAAGYLEDASFGPFSALLVVDADGTARGQGRRAHSGPPGDPATGRGGWLSIVAVGGRRCGLVIGSDLALPEVGRALVVAGADLLLAAGSDPGEGSRVLARARALENGVPVAFAAPGHGLLIDAAGTVLAATGPAEPLAVATLARGPEAQARLAVRRPDLYRVLADPEPPRAA